MNNSRVWLNNLLVISFGLVFAYSLWSATVGWDTPIVQQYEFVQAKAAIGAYYIASGGPILRYEFPIFGPPWSVPYEFPIYQVASAWTHNFTGMPLEQAGRLVGKIFFYLSCIPLFFIARVLGFRGKTILIPITLFLASPIYLFWSRQFMNESTAIFFSLAYLMAAMLWIKKSNNMLWFIAVALGAIAALAKSTTYVSFALVVGIYLSFEMLRNRSFTLSRLVRSFVVLLFPLIVGLVWVRFTDSLKSMNPIAADIHVSTTWVKSYLFNAGLSERMGSFWYHLFRITIHDAIGHRTVWIFSVLFAVFLGKRAWLYWLCSLLFLVAPLIFAHAHMTHDYYANANAIFLVFAIAALVERAVVSEKKWISLLGAILFVLVIGYEVRDFMGKGYIQQQERRMEPVIFAKKLQKIVAPNDVLLMYGEDWCPVIAFQAERRAIMLQNGNWYNPRLAESLSLLHAEGKKVGVTVLCHEARTDQKLLKHISLGPLLLRDLCDVYAYQ